MRKTFVNIVYNGLYQLLILVLPLFSVPYLARTLSQESLGINAYVNSIPVFLSVIILFGMNQYGAKMIAQTEEKDLPQRFARLWQIQLVVGLATILVYLVTVLLFLDYKLFFLLEIPFLIGYVLDISWFYIGLGQIKTVVTRNSIIKLAIFASIFIFVHSSDDLWKYLLINSITYLANIVFWFGMRKQLGRKLTKVDFGFQRQYFFDALKIVLPSIAVQFYVSFDQTIMKWLTSSTELAFYSQSQQLSRAIITMVGSISTILMPKMAQMLLQKNGQKQVVKLLKTVLDYTLVISLYFTIMFMINADKFVVWYWGAKYAPMGPVMLITSLIIALVSYGGVYANQYTLSRGLYREFSIPYYAGAVFSIVLNLLLIPHFQAIGGALTIVATEGLVCFLRIWLIRRELPLRQVLQNQWRPLLAAGLTLAVGLLVPINLSTLFVDLVLQTIMGSVVYLILLVVLKDQMIRDLTGRVKQIVARRRAR